MLPPERDPHHTAFRHRASAERDPGDDPALDTLLRAAGQGDMHAFDAFYERTAPAVFGLLSRVLGEQVQAEQAATRVFLELWRRAPQFDPADGSAHALLMRTTRRELVQHIHTLVAAGPSPCAVGGLDPAGPD